MIAVMKAIFAMMKPDIRRLVGEAAFQNDDLKCAIAGSILVRTASRLTRLRRNGIRLREHINTFWCGSAVSMRCPENCIQDDTYFLKVWRQYLLALPDTVMHRRQSTSDFSCTQMSDLRPPLPGKDP